MKFSKMRIILLIFCIQSALAVFLNKKRNYEDLIISIQESTKQFDITKIQESMQNFAGLLKTQFQIKMKNNIKVIFPSSWNKTKIKDSKPLDDQSLDSNASIIIGPVTNLYGETPFTLHLGGCGQPGEYIYITPEIITKESTPRYGSTSQVLLHEWAHYRWGVFDEYGIEGEASKPFYMNENKKIKATGCPSGLEGWLLKQTNDTFTKCNAYNEFLPEVGCRFYIFENNQRLSTMMGIKQGNNFGIKSNSKICGSPDSIDHNDQGPSMQNLMCGHKSVWEVMKQHEDFLSCNDTCIKEGNKSQGRIKIDYFQRKETSPDQTFSINLNIPSQFRENRKIKEVIEWASKFFKFVNFTLTLQNTSVEENSNFKDGWNVGCFKCKKTTDLNFTCYSEETKCSKPFKLEMATRDSGETFAKTFLSKILPKTKLPVVVYRRQFPGHDHQKKVIDIDTNCRKAMFLAKLEIKNQSDSSSMMEFNGKLYHELHKRNGKEYFLRDPLNTSTLVSLIDKPTGKWIYELKGMPDNSSVTVNVVCLLHNHSLSIISRVFETKKNSSTGSISLIKVLTVCLMDGLLPVINASVTAVDSSTEADDNFIHLYDNGIGPDKMKGDGIYSNEYSNFSSNGFHSFSFHIDVNEHTKILQKHTVYSINRNDKLAISAATHPGSNFPFPVDTINKTESRKIIDQFGEPKTEFVREDMDDSIGEGYTFIEPEVQIMTLPTQKRTTDPIVIEITNLVPNEDEHSPGKVTDLQIVSHSHKHSTVSLQWTSAGDNGFSGTAKTIDIRYHQDLKTFPSKFYENGIPVNETDLRGGDLNPLPARTKHKVIVKVDKGNSTYPENLVFYFALLYKDKKGNTGSVSNLATVFFPPAKYSKELQRLKTKQSSSSVMLYCFLIFLVCLIIFIGIVKFYHHHKYWILRNRLE